MTSTLTLGITPGIHYDVLYLAETNLIVALNTNVTAADLQGAVNVLLKLMNQRQIVEETKAFIANR